MAKDPCLQYDNMELKQKSKALPFLISVGEVCVQQHEFFFFFAALPMSTNDYKRIMSVDFEITNKF